MNPVSYYLDTVPMPCSAEIHNNFTQKRPFQGLNEMMYITYKNYSRL